MFFPLPGIEMPSVQGSEENMYKSKLQELCQKKRWALPIYSAMKDGSEHNPQFKASVLVNGTNFDTINICKSLKEAYNEAAKSAFFHFSSDDKSTPVGTNVDEQTLKTADADSQIQINKVDNELPCKGNKFEQAGVSADVKTSSFGDGSVNLTAEIDAAEKSDRILKGPEIHPDCLDMGHDTKQKFKPKLQIYAQRKNIGLPMYHSTRVGPPNSLCFSTTVTVGGDSFKSAGSYKTIKQAEDAAAQVALMAFSTEAFQENDIRLYKNLLQEYALREGFFMPQYKTTRTGEAHDPTFNATVEVEGEIFHGNPAMSKKLAELSAAKVAYTNLMQRKYCQTGDFSSGSSRNEVLKLASCLNFLTHEEVRVNCKSESRTSSTLSARYGVPTEVNKDEDEETVSSGYLEAKTGFEMEEAISVPADAGKCFKIGELSSSSSEDVLKLTPGTKSQSINISEMQRSRCPKVSISTAKYVARAEAKKAEEEAILDRSIPERTKFKINENILVSSCKDSSTMKMATDIKSYLLNNRIRVYTYIPDVASTKGNVVLPIGEGKWVVGSLEFPK